MPSCRTPFLSSLCRSFLAAILFALATPSASFADILITEVIPNVTTTAARGDVVELFNTGPGAVDLTDWVLTDLDDDPVAGVPMDATFAPGSLGLAPLAAGDYAVVEFVDAAGTASWQATNYGLRIVAPLVAGSFLGSERDELMLLDAADTPVDFVAWSDTGTTVTADSYEDLSAVTGVVFDYGLTPGDAAWSGAETIVDDAGYYAATVDFTAFAAVSAWGGGSIRRRSSGETFDVGAPDGPAQWEVVPRWQASLGNASDDVAQGGGLRPIRVTDELASWLGQAESTTFPDRRIAPLADQMPADFATADPAARSAWEGVLALAMAGQWEEAFAAADAIGCEVVEFLDTTTGLDFHVLRERVVPDQPGFTGRGLFVFHDGPAVRERVVLEVPHPIFDGETLEEGALAIGQVLPRVAMFAGTHRNNSLDETTCDGTFGGGDPYRISDVSHHPDNFFHVAHVWLDGQIDDMLAIQLHGFCCPGAPPYETLTDDCVVSNGIEAATSPTDFPQILRDRIDAQAHLAGGIDLTTAAVFGDDADVLGATNNLQGRVSNGVAPIDACNTEAIAASGRFAHLEQDPGVRDDPQHIVDALVEALDIEDAEPPSPCGAAPAMDCRFAGIGKALVSFADSSDDSRDRFGWKWSKGEATDLSAFGDPVAGSASYHVCVYDDSASPQPLMDLAVPAAATCGAAPCWKATGTKGFSYSDKLASNDGVRGLKMKAGVDGKAALRLKGIGAGLVVPALPPLQPLTVQMLVDDGVTTECWQSTFTNPPLTSSTTKFRAKQ
jgi:hypothetical protein